MAEVKVKMVEWFNQHWYKVTVYTGPGQEETRMIPSVTTKLGVTDKPFLAQWRGDIGNREADMRLFEAQQRGSRIHFALNVLTTNGIVIYNPWQKPNYNDEDIVEISKQVSGNISVMKYQDEMLAVIKLQRWLEAVKPEILFSERTVYSLTHNDAGTADLGICIKGGAYDVNGSRKLTIPEGNYIVDLKTGSMVSEEAHLQTAAYVKCAEEMKIADFVGTIILHTSSKNKGGIEGLSTILRLREEVEQDYVKYRKYAELWQMKNADAAPRVFEFPSLVTLRKEVITT